MSEFRTVGAVYDRPRSRRWDILGGHRPPLQFVFLLLLTACDELHQVSHSGRGAYEASMAALANGFAVAWYDDRDGNAEIYFRLLNAMGRPAGPEHRITTDAELSYEADIAAADGSLAIAWYERLANGNLRARLGMWSETGEQRWSRIISASGRNGRNILVRSNKAELFAAWIEDGGGETAEVWSGWWDFQGRALTPPQRLAAASRTTWNLNATLDSLGRAWVVFDAKDSTKNNELFVVRTDKTNTDTLRLTSDDGFASKYPDIAFSADRAALTWFDERDGNQEVYLFVAPAADLREGLEQRARRITNTPGESMGAYVASNGTRFGLAWCDKSEGQHEIYFQDFDSDGAPLHDAHRLTHTRTESLIPAIKPWAETFALTWNEYASREHGHSSNARSEVVFAFAR